LSLKWIPTPNEIQLNKWYIVDSNDTALEGKYYPKIKSRKLSLSNTIVYAYNITIFGNRKLSA
jgi:hypothetical protein